MTREEQLDWLCRLRSEIFVYMPEKWLIPMATALDEAISDIKRLEMYKIDYGARLKADMLNALIELQSEYNAYASVWMAWTDDMRKEEIAQEALNASKARMSDLIQEKINALKGENDGD